MHIVGGTKFSCHNSWMEGACVDSNKQILTAGFLNLGYFSKREKCLAACFTFAKTGCEHDKTTGECLAHTEDVKFQVGSVAIIAKKCYKFESADSADGITL